MNGLTLIEGYFNCVTAPAAWTAVKEMHLAQLGVAWRESGLTPASPNWRTFLLGRKSWRLSGAFKSTPVEVDGVVKKDFFRCRLGHGLPRYGSGPPHGPVQVGRAPT